MIKTLKLAGLASLLLVMVGCATSTIEKRRTEKSSFYSTITPEYKELVDKGQIKIGMPSDAVYIAWGAPAQVLNGENEKGADTTWLYQGTSFEEYRHWNYRQVRSGGRTFTEQYLDFDYLPRDYVSAEVIFVGGKVKSWRTLAKPATR